MLENYIAFIGSSIIITLAPGPDIIFSITQGITYGKKAGVTTALGLAAGNIVHTLLAIFGVAVIFKTNAYAFNILKYFGMAYLVYLSVKSFVHRNEPLNVKAGGKKEKNMFLRGFIMNVVNPKVALFFIAFFPQFVDPKFGSVTMQMLILGAFFILQVIFVFGTLSYYAGIVGAVLNQRPRVAKYINISASVIFIALAIKLLLLQRL